MFEDIRPYDDIQTVAAVKRLATSGMIDSIVSYLYPGTDVDSFRTVLDSITGVDDLQSKVVYHAVESILDKTSDGLSYSGLEYFTSEPGHRFLLLSNHRDIVLDPALVQYILKRNSLPSTEIAVGDNLISNPLIEDMMRSNRMIKVVRHGSQRELYTASKSFSDYLRRRVACRSLEDESVPDVSGGSSVWLAQRQGRTKDGHDTTEQGLLKMLDISGGGDFAQNFKELSIMPVAISYEWEPCALRKAVEVVSRRLNGSYTKRPGEDLESILTGIKQSKGRITVNFCKPLTSEEIDLSAGYDKNARFRALAEIIDKRIINAYQLYETNHQAYLIMTNQGASPSFSEYLEKEISNASEDIDRDLLKKQLVEMYATPYIRKTGAAVPEAVSL